MTEFIEIKPGRWVLAFNDGYEPRGRTMAEHIAMFKSRGGGWDSHRASEIFHVSEVVDTTPARYHPHSYTIGQSVTRPGELNTRQYRGSVIAAGTKEKMISLRDRLFAIGSEADDAIEAEMYRRVEKFAAREQAKAIKKIHKLLPHIFGERS